MTKVPWENYDFVRNELRISVATVKPRSSFSETNTTKQSIKVLLD